MNTTGAAITWAVSALGYPGFDDLSSRRGTVPAPAPSQRRGRGARGGTPAVEAAPLFLPYLGDGERDDPTARAGFVGLSDRHDRAAMAFAVAEGVALAVRSVLAALEQAGLAADRAADRRRRGPDRPDRAAQGGPARPPGAAPGLDPAGFGAAMLAADAAGYRRGGRRGHLRDGAAGTAVCPVTLVERLRG